MIPRLKDYSFTESVTVCSMYIDDPSLCIYTKVYRFDTAIHTLDFLFILLFSNQSHSNISVIN